MSQPNYLEKRFRFTNLIPKLILHCQLINVNIDLGPGLFIDLFKNGTDLTPDQQAAIEQYWRDIGGEIKKGYWTVE